MTWPEAEPLPNVPDWAVDAVFYQIFPERFRNGDPSNDPTHDSLEFPDSIPKSWTISPWTGDWYVRAQWEKEAGDDFYANGVFNRRYGGDLQGVIDKLGYLEELGINAIYFNPVFYGRSLHKYDGVSMHHIDPHFGPSPAADLKLIASETSDPKSWHWTTADKLFLKLLAQAHARGIRIIVDGVFNHTGRDFFAFADLRQHQESSRYVDWYVVKRLDDPATRRNEFKYKGWWNNDTLPEFADNAAGDDLHPGPKRYVMSITARWMDPDGDGDPSDGVDGWRLDVAQDIPLPFWKEWNAEVRRLNPEAYTVAEVWNDAQDFLVEGGFSATMNYHAFAFLTKGFLVDARISASEFGCELDLRRQRHPPAMQFAVQNLADSHDTDRLGSMIVNRPVDRPYLEPERFDYDVPPRASPRHDPTYEVRRPNDDERRLQRMVVLMQMTYLGAPMIYYGDEVGMWGGDDPCDRCPMLWEDLGPYAFQAADPLNRPREADAVAVDRELFDFYREAIALRHEHPVLRHGSCSAFASDDQAKFFAFRRELKGEQVLVAFHRGDNSYQWKLPSGAKMLDVVFATDADCKSKDNGETRSIVMPALSAAVLAIP